MPKTKKLLHTERNKARGLCRVPGCKAYKRLGFNECQTHTGNAITKLSKSEKLALLEDKRRKGYISNSQYEQEFLKLSN